MANQNRESQQQETWESSSEIIDISTLTPLYKSDKEWRYCCPVCLDKRGKPDHEGKLYWNIIKNVGYCFKCNTSFFREEAENVSFNREEIEWKKTIEGMLRNYSDTFYSNLEFPKEVPFDFPELTYDLLVNLKKRNPFLIPLKDMLGFRSWQGRDTGVVIPFIYNGKICKFQTRFVTRRGLSLDKDDKMKYYTSPGPKCLYSPFHIFNNFHTLGKEDELTIAEGVFDAIALGIMKFPNPVAILGDHLTPLQLWDIRHLTPTITKIYLCLDDVKRNDYIEKIVRRLLPCVEEIEKFSFWLPDFKDAEEFLRGNLHNTELRKECLEGIRTWFNETR